MTTWKLTLGLCLVATTAAAQPAEPTTTPPSDQTPPPPPPETGTPVTTTSSSGPTQGVIVDSKPMPMTEPVDDNRPAGFSVGVGFGYSLPTSLETPNVTSARFRLGSGLTFEPVIRFQQTSREVDVGMTSKDKATTIEIGALARYPLRGRGRVDLVLLGGAFVENTSETPDGDNMDKSTTTFEARYGFAVEYWISNHWQISMNALNTIFSTTKVSQEQGPATETVTTNTLFGAIYDPVISAMVHLYY